MLGGAIRILEITLMARRKLAPQSSSRSVAKDGYNWSAAVSTVRLISVAVASFIDNLLKCFLSAGFVADPMIASPLLTSLFDVVQTSLHDLQ